MRNFFSALSNPGPNLPSLKRSRDPSEQQYQPRSAPNPPPNLPLEASPYTSLTTRPPIDGHQGYAGYGQVLSGDPLATLPQGTYPPVGGYDGQILSGWNSPWTSQQGAHTPGDQPNMGGHEYVGYEQAPLELNSFLTLMPSDYFPETTPMGLGPSFPQYFQGESTTTPYPFSGISDLPPYPAIEPDSIKLGRNLPHEAGTSEFMAAQTEKAPLPVAKAAPETPDYANHPDWISTKQYSDEKKIPLRRLQEKLAILRRPNPDPTQPPLLAYVTEKGKTWIHKDSALIEGGGLSLRKVVEKLNGEVRRRTLEKVCSEERLYLVTEELDGTETFKRAAYRHPSSGNWEVIFPENGKLRILTNAEKKKKGLPIAEKLPIKPGYIRLSSWQDPREEIDQIKQVHKNAYAKKGHLGDFDENGEWKSLTCQEGIRTPYFIHPKAKIKMGFGLPIETWLKMADANYCKGTANKNAKEGRYVRTITDPKTGIKKTVAGALKNASGKYEIWADAYLLKPHETESFIKPQ